MQDFKKLFDNLAGEWKLIRHISSGEQFTGTAHFEMMPDAAFVLKETGELRMPTGSVITASREWYWAYSANDELMISYNEIPLRLYHHLKLELSEGCWIGNATHLCAPDTYSGSYEFNENTISIKQAVMGPKKDYFVSSQFERY